MHKKTTNQPSEQQQNAENLELFLQPTFYLDIHHPSIQNFTQQTTKDCRTTQEKIQALFEEVRDRFAYNAFALELEPESLKVSNILTQRETFCIPKAMVFAASLRILGIPTRLGFANVCNHLASPRLLEVLQSEVFAFHGYVECWIDGCWRKASPTFEKALCEKLGLSPLTFDGTEDALLHPFSANGTVYMEYIHHHGTFADLPREQMLSVWAEHYPHIFGEFKTQAEK